MNNSGPPQLPGLAFNIELISELQDCNPEICEGKSDTNYLISKCFQNKIQA